MFGITDDAPELGFRPLRGYRFFKFRISDMIVPISVFPSPSGISVLQIGMAGVEDRFSVFPSPSGISVLQIFYDAYCKRHKEIVSVPFGDIGSSNGRKDRGGVMAYRFPSPSGISVLQIISVKSIEVTDSFPSPSGISVLQMLLILNIKILRSFRPLRGYRFFK